MPALINITHTKLHRTCILDHLGTNTKNFHQSEPKGTAHALREYIENNQTLENILVMQSDDCLLLTPEIIHDSTRLHTCSNADTTILLTTQFDSTHHRKSYGIDDDKNVISIVPIGINHPRQQLYFSGIACFNSKFLREVFPKLSYQSEGEMSLFSLFDYVHSNRINFKGFIVPGMWIGVNTSAQLIQAREFVK